MTAGERLVALAGHGGTAAALLLAIAQGATTGNALVNYSGLPTATASQHLGVTKQISGGGWIYWDYVRPSSKKLQEVKKDIQELKREAKRVIRLVKRSESTQDKQKTDLYASLLNNRINALKRDYDDIYHKLNKNYLTYRLEQFKRLQAIKREESDIAFVMSILSVL